MRFDLFSFILGCLVGTTGLQVIKTIVEKLLTL